MHLVSRCFTVLAVGFLSSSLAMAKDPIKIGVMFPLTGPIATQGVPLRDAVKQAFDEEKYQVAGRKIELLFEDSAGRPDVGLSKVKALVERDKVDMLISVLVSSVGLAIAPYVTQQKIPWVSTAAVAALTRDLKSPYVYRFVPSSYQFGLAAAEAAKRLGWKKVYYIGWNAAVAREPADAIRKVLGKDSIVEAMFPNVGTPDFAPYLSRIDASKADGVMVAVWGVDAPRFTQQFAEYGLAKKLPMFGLASFTSEELLPYMPADSVGVLSAYPYCGSLSTPENEAFVEGFRKRYSSIPGAYQYLGYQAARMVIESIKKIDGNVEDRSSFVKALSSTDLKGPMGNTRFDEYNGIIADFFVLEVVKGGDGKLQNKCRDRLPHIKDPYSLFP